MVKAPGNAEVQDAMPISSCLITDNGLRALFVLLAVLDSNRPQQQQLTFPSLFLLH